MASSSGDKILDGDRSWLHSEDGTIPEGDRTRQCFKDGEEDMRRMFSSADEQRTKLGRGPRGRVEIGPQLKDVAFEGETLDRGRRRTDAKPKALTTGKSIAARDRNWEPAEKTLLLLLKDFILRNRFQVDSDKLWADYVCNELGRASGSCQQQWDSLLKFYKVIRDHQMTNRSGPEDYWKMDDKHKDIINAKRTANKPPLPRLPKVFQQLWYILIEGILQIRSSKKDLANSPRGLSADMRSQPSSSHDQDTMDHPLPLPSTRAGTRVEDEVPALPVGEKVKTEILPSLLGQEENKQKYRERKLALKEEKLNLKRKEMEDKQKYREWLVASGEEALAQKHRKTLHLEVGQHPSYHPMVDPNADAFVRSFLDLPNLEIIANSVGPSATDM